MAQVTYREIARLLPELENFNGNSMSAHRGSEFYHIYSYRTEIARVTFVDRKVTLLSRKFSATTSRHQSHVRRAFPQYVEVEAL